MIYSYMFFLLDEIKLFILLFLGYFFLLYFNIVFRERDFEFFNVNDEYFMFCWFILWGGCFGMLGGWIIGIDFGKVECMFIFFLWVFDIFGIYFFIWFWGRNKLSFVERYCCCFFEFLFLRWILFCFL